MALSAWEVPLKAIVLETKLGHGAFGVVWKGRLTEFPEWMKKASVAAARKIKLDNNLQIAVKTINSKATKYRCRYENENPVVCKMR